MRDEFYLIKPGGGLQSAAICCCLYRRNNYWISYSKILLYNLPIELVLSIAGFLNSKYDTNALY